MKWTSEAFCVADYSNNSCTTSHAILYGISQDPLILLDWKRIMQIKQPYFKIRLLIIWIIIFSAAFQLHADDIQLFAYLHQMSMYSHAR